MASGAPAWAWMAVLTIGTSIRWFGWLSETNTVGTSVAYQGISAAIGVDHLIRMAASWAKPFTLAKTNAASYFSRVVRGGFLGDDRHEIHALLPCRLALRRRLEEVDFKPGILQLVPDDVEVGQRIRHGEVRTAGDAVQPDPLVRLRGDGQVLRCVLHQGDGLVRNFGSDGQMRVAADPLPSASTGGTRASRADLCSPSEAFRARIRRRASCSRASVMTPDL